MQSRSKCTKIPELSSHLPTLQDPLPTGLSPDQRSSHPDPGRLEEYSTQTSVSNQGSQGPPDPDRLQHYTPMPPTTAAPEVTDTPDPARLLGYTPHPTVGVFQTSETRRLAYQLTPAPAAATGPGSKSGVQSLPYIPPYRPPRRIATTYTPQSPSTTPRQE